MKDLLAAELLKLRTTRTPWALLVSTVAVSALAVASAVAVGSDASFDPQTVDGLRTVLSTSAAGAILVLVLGIIVSGGEYRHGTATDTFLTTPRRWRVIVAKLTTGAIVGIVFGALASGVALAVAALTYRLKDFTFPLGSSQAWSTLGGAVLYAALFGGIGAATGSLVRNQVAGIVGWIVWLTLVEHLAVGLVPSIGRWLPASAGRALVGGSNGDLLSPLAGAIVLIAYAVVIMGAAVVIERYRDA